MPVAPMAPPSAEPARPVPSVSPAFAGLPGWREDDHMAGLRAFAAGCGVARNPSSAWVCGLARGLGPVDDTGARVFLETYFRPEATSEAGLLTAYFTPIYEARTQPDRDFSAPLRPRPADLPRPRADGGLARPYADRAHIAARPAPDALAWLKPEDLFFLQIQGSGVLTFPDRPPRRVVFDGSNGAPFMGIAAPMRQAGLLPDANTSADAIRAWLAAHRGTQADALMNLNRRYVFFRLEPDDGVEPAGAAGQRLIPGRALAVDPSRHDMGELLWLDASAPALSGAFPVYRRLAMALDTGGAIKGETRADLYLGRGQDAGQEAGRVRHQLHLYRLTPISPPAS